MANPLHLSQLQQGVAAWNIWRVEHPHCRPDLRGAYLQGKDLARINLSDADLRFAFLFRANLRSANLRGAVLTGADLIQAQLQGSDLRDAILTGTYLTRADLGQANLQGADLRGAMLRGAHLGQALLPTGRGTVANLGRTRLQTLDFPVPNDRNKSSSTSPCPPLIHPHRISSNPDPPSNLSPPHPNPLDQIGRTEIL